MLDQHLKLTISDWLGDIMLAQYQHAERNLETHGAFLVEDFEHLKKEEFDCAVKNLFSRRF